MPENNLNEITEHMPGVIILKLGENIQGGNEALEFSSMLFSLKEKGSKCVIVNLENVKMMNSSGLGMLVGGLNTLRKNDIIMNLVNIPEKIENLLKMTHLDQVFTTFKSVEEALESYK